MKKSKKALCSAIAVLTLFTGVSIPSNVSSDNGMKSSSIVQVMDADASSSSVVRGRFNGQYWTGLVNICSPNPNKPCKIKICTFSADGWRSGGTIDYVVYSNGRYVTQRYGVGTVAYVKLPAGYSCYQIKIKPHNYGSGIIASGRNFTNSGKCSMWSIDY